ncbi:unnamed protein product [Linum trigynum]
MDKKLQNPREEKEEEETMMAARLVGKEDEMEELGNQLAISFPFTQYPKINQVDHPPLLDSSSAMGKQAHRRRQQDEKKAEPGLRCPRCESTDTKFCYFNNYNLCQPRHFCRACKRSWTRGGVLRDVPAGGGGGRKNKGRVIHPSSSE